MKKFIITITLLITLVGSVFATDWRKVDTKVFSDEACARASGYASYKDYQNEIAYYNTLAIANILSNIGTIAGNTLK